MEANSILKDCPHCGARKELLIITPSGNAGNRWFVYCSQCFPLSQVSQMSAAEAWNTRAEEDAMQDEIVRLKAENERLLRMLEKDARS